MATIVFNASRRRAPAPSGAIAYGSPVAIRFAGVITANLALNDQVKLCRLPKRHIPFDLIMDWPDLDTGTTLVYNVGLYEDDTADDSTVGTVVDADALIAASTTARAVGRERMGNALQAAIAAVYTPSDSDRIVVMTATTAASGLSGTPTVRGILMCTAYSGVPGLDL